MFYRCAALVATGLRRGSVGSSDSELKASAKFAEEQAQAMLAAES